MWDWLGNHPDAGQKEIQDRFTLSRSTAYDILGRFAEASCFEDFSRQSRSGRKRKPNLVLQGHIARVLRADCNLTFRGVRRMLRVRWGERVSKDTISRTLRRMHWSRKRVSKVPVGRNTSTTLEARKSYALEVAPFADDDILFLDECGVNLHTTTSNYGHAEFFRFSLEYSAKYSFQSFAHFTFSWAPRGVRAVANVENQKGVNNSVIIAVSSSGRVVTRVYDGAVNGLRLQSFLKQDLFPEIETWPHQPRLLVMDNVPFHHKPVCMSAGGVAPYLRVPRICV